MGENKKLAINMIAQIIAFVVNVGISLLLTPFIVNHIGKEAYGFVGLSNNFIGYAQVVVVALNSMAARFVTISVSRKEYKEANRYFSSIFYSNQILAFFLLSISLFVVFNLNNLVNIPIDMGHDVKLLFILVFTNFLLSTSFSVYGIATFTKNRLDLASVRSISSNIIRVVAMIVCYVFFSPKVWYIGLAAVISTIYVLATNIVLTRRLLPELSISLINVERSKIIRLLKSGGWNSITQLSTVLASGLDLLIANLFIGASAMGTLSLVKLVPMYLLSLFSMIAYVYAPNLTVSYSRNDFQSLKEQLLSSLKFFNCLSSIPIILLIVYGDNFFYLWIPKEDFRLIYILTLMACFELCFALPLQNIWNVFMVTNKLKVPSLNLLARGVVSISFIYIVMHVVPETYRLYYLAGIASLLGGIDFLFFLPLYGAKCLNLSWKTFYPPLIKNLCLILIVSIVFLLIKSMIGFVGWGMLVFECILTTVLILIFNCFALFSKKDRKHCLQYVTSYWIKVKRNKIGEL